MKPYFERGDIAIFHGDSREIVPSLDFDSIVSDPPYGIGVVNERGSVGGRNRARIGNYAPIVGDDAPFNPAWLLALAKPTILWGGNCFAGRLPSSRGWLVWDKREGSTPDDFSDCELAWTNLDQPVRMFSHLWRGMVKKDRYELRGWHPAQKPLALMKWCLTFTEGIILDPYLGSGTTLVAAKLENRRAIGVEIDERYCEIAAKRLAQEVFTFEGAKP